MQVLSESVARFMEEYYPAEMSETAKLFRWANRFFDWLNVHPGGNFKNPDCRPYERLDDPRFQLLRDFLQYLADWKASVMTMPNLSARRRPGSSSHIKLMRVRFFGSCL